MTDPTPDPTPELIAQRADRIKQMQTAFLDAIRRHDPSVGPEFQVILTPDAALDFFEEGFLDAPETDWLAFLEEFKTGTFSPGDEGELSDAERARLTERLESAKRLDLDLPKDNEHKA